MDNAAPPRTGTATISVTVDNVNDNDPVITNPSGIRVIINECLSELENVEFGCTSNTY